MIKSEFNGNFNDSRSHAELADLEMQCHASRRDSNDSAHLPERLCDLTKCHKRFLLYRNGFVFIFCHLAIGFEFVTSGVFFKKIWVQKRH